MNKGYHVLFFGLLDLVASSSVSLLISQEPDFVVITEANNSILTRKMVLIY